MMRFTTTITVPGSPDLVQSDTQVSDETIGEAAARHAMNIAALLVNEQPGDLGTWTVTIS